MAILEQAIPNMPAPLEDVSRKIVINAINVVDTVKRFYISYEIQYFKDGVDISAAFKNTAKTWEIGNEKTVYQRNLADFSPIPNPDFIDAETTPDELEYLEAPAYDYLLSVFREHPELIWTLLTGYILENYNDGWFENI